MDQYTCNAQMAAELMPAMVKGRIQFMVRWPSPDLAIIEVASQDMPYLKSEAIHLNMIASGVQLDMSKLEWAIVDDSAWPNLNLWEDATHQITFDGGKHWTNVILEEGNPAYYVACSDGKRSWLVDMMSPQYVVKRTNDREYIPGQTATGRISDPPQVERLPRGTPNGLTVKPCPYRHPPTSVCPHCQDWERKRVPASVGEQAFQTCGFLDTEFDSDPSLVGE